MSAANAPRGPQSARGPDDEPVPMGDPPDDDDLDGEDEDIDEDDDDDEDEDPVRV